MKQGKGFFGHNLLKKNQFKVNMLYLYSNLSNSFNTIQTSFLRIFSKYFMKVHQVKQRISKFLFLQVFNKLVCEKIAKLILEFVFGSGEQLKFLIEFLNQHEGHPESCLVHQIRQQITNFFSSKFVQTRSDWLNDSQNGIWNLFSDLVFINS